MFIYRQCLDIASITRCAQNNGFFMCVLFSNQCRVSESSEYIVVSFMNILLDMDSAFTASLSSKILLKLI